MAKDRDPQEKGIRLGGTVFNSDESAEIVNELKARVKDQNILNEVEDVLNGRKTSLSSRARDVLQILAAGLIMRRRKK